MYMVIQDDAVKESSKIEAICYSIWYYLMKSSVAD